eukprot:CAMPEP_0171452422 /NCGR_PEP_ID=MMETSP0945-20130129/538_1 /TAXON_ID=109269 /ORGANISM="Vaucheria litorea, Strain CCMP2940" /LENGTH=105 /DNA_ID=CAMNT_0011977089 /DNA_START=247 /DNA_END=564 /DNA_ORIENTATION=+
MILQFTCNKCEGKTTLKINKVAYEEGVVICTCSKCGIRHIIADNKGLLDDSDFGKGNIEQYLSKKGRDDEMIKASLADMSPETLEKFNLSSNEGCIEILRKDSEE